MFEKQFEQKYIGVIHPEIQLRYLDFLFYDSIQLMVDLYPTNKDSELLFTYGILKPLNKNINFHEPKLNILCPDIIATLNSLVDRLYLLSEIPELGEWHGTYWDAGDIPTKQQYFEYRAADNAKKSLRRLVLTPETQACAVLISQDPEQKAIPILPENANYYSKFVSGYVIRFLDIGIPNMPISDLLKFKNDNQDKLRRFRLAIKSFHESHDDFESTLEEIALAFNDYKKSLSLINRKYEISNLELKFSFVDALSKFLTNFQISVFSTKFQIEKANIQKQIDIDAAKGSEVSYLYEVGELAKQVSSQNIIRI